MYDSVTYSMAMRWIRCKIHRGKHHRGFYELTDVGVHEGESTRNPPIDYGIRFLFCHIYSNVIG